MFVLFLLIFVSACFRSVVQADSQRSKQPTGRRNHGRVWRDGEFYFIPISFYSFTSVFLTQKESN